jgi:ABC-type Fe3+ transport system substrate-binding protein
LFTLNDLSKPIHILTRHPLPILQQFASAFFNSSYANELGYSQNDIDKIVFIQQFLTENWIDLLSNPNDRINLAWGGGPSLFNQLASIDLLAEISSELEMSIFEGFNITDTISNMVIKQFSNEELVWITNSFSSFGFTVNHGILNELNLPVPKSWKDLATPIYFNDDRKLIGLGDAPQSTSITRIYELILQRYGWKEGWKIIGGMAGNGEVIGGATQTREAVVNNEVAVALTIDFYGIIAQIANPNTEYILPQGDSFFSGDPIAFGKFGENPQLAEAFFKFLFSPEAQAIFVQNNVLPINQDAFQHSSVIDRDDMELLYKEALIYQGFDFNEDLAVSRGGSVKAYFNGTITLVQSELRAAWKSLINQLRINKITEVEFNNFVNVLFEPILSETDAIRDNDLYNTDPEFRNTKVSEWVETKRNRFQAFQRQLEPSFLIIDFLFIIPLLLVFKLLSTIKFNSFKRFN